MCENNNFRSLLVTHIKCCICNIYLFFKMNCQYLNITLITWINIIKSNRNQRNVNNQITKYIYMYILFFMKKNIYLIFIRYYLNLNLSSDKNKKTSNQDVILFFKKLKLKNIWSHSLGNSFFRGVFDWNLKEFKKISFVFFIIKKYCCVW